MEEGGWGWGGEALHVFVVLFSCSFSGTGTPIDVVLREDQESLIAQLGKPETLLELSTTQYGSYVARALMQDARVDVPWIH